MTAAARNRGGPTPDLALREPVHRHSYRVIYGDTDAAGVVYYGNYLRLLEMGRTEYFRHRFGLSYRQLGEEGILLPATEVYCRYKASARYDDDLVIATSLARHTRVTLRFHYEITREADGRLLAAAFTTHAAVDRNGRLTSLPEALRRCLEVGTPATGRPGGKEAPPSR
ncbi:acyl-CoA thioesterase [Dissulfurirhabdus thermomarina]|uniref:Acyl-CoA thioesterase n=1 Tax=Dissulfurirhabdus thermomarina TaxID=1765737 RepID=A0A6N9TTL5_DISTH|nr:thioesterase family protein [Dissulfurirhabdus thermomarina]NDY41846.1 acyl-CoA thioesterase [Dissulfurirhabdus thermomarina]NMX22994.1 acyl-CoA thioesterase [Dissulfurirhabdus thermomarina]